MGASSHVINLVSALVSAIAIPFVAIATTYLYYDLLVREQVEPEGARRSTSILPSEI